MTDDQRAKELLLASIGLLQAQALLLENTRRLLDAADVGRAETAFEAAKLVRQAVELLSDEDDDD